MDNLEYINQKITLYGEMDDVSIEQSAKVMFISMGFEVYDSNKYNTLVKLTKYKNKKTFENLFEVLNNDKSGIPDLLIIKEDNATFVEVKRVKGNYRDSLNQNQLAWIESHPQYKVIVLYLEFEAKDNANSYIHVLEKRIKYLERELCSLREIVKQIRFNIDHEFDRIYNEVYDDETKDNSS